ncbi:class I SAM-dependent methyltransferase [Corallococcus praedator]|uniref:Class I SAM-dependent methyltransferase n=1 Tax=Corallococcus praedator TaxID=2316724 RepID=A0ABX9QNM6_9BACT|nr:MULTISPECIES: class I SAM-dependent methyltransferase [Corallococcus]RKH32431.1 class I SAM-dependent methyltransferase [Corallococcus sp. CA031C]RKI12330.1 class I SAM-dependent methyltransferase [Corallococcus praedator]
MRVSTHFALWMAGMAQAETQTTAGERACLARYAAGRQRLVEIGVWHGVTTRVLRAVMDPSATLWAVDPYPVGRLRVSFQQLIAHREVGSVNNGRVDWVRATGADAARQHRERGLPAVDFVFIDGDHTYEGLQGDWTGWSPLVAPGAIIALHDTHSSPSRPLNTAGSARYTRDVILHDPAFECVDTHDSLTVMRRREG